MRVAYDSIAKDFSATRNFAWPELSVFIPYLPDSFKILDLGCGNGRLLSVLEASGKKFDYQGVDFSKGLLKQAQKQWPRYHFDLADMDQVDLPTNYFDIVVMVASFHHLTNKSKRQELLNKVYASLKPGGLLFMTNWNLAQRKYWSSWFKHWWYKRSWSDCFVSFTLPNTTQKYLRYYHHFTKRELKTLLLQAHFKLEPLGIYRTKYNLNCLVKK